MGRVAKQQHGKHPDNKSAASNSGATKQAAGSEKHHAYLVEQRAMILSNRAEKRREAKRITEERETMQRLAREAAVQS